MRFAVVAHRESETNLALAAAGAGSLLTPRQALLGLGRGDVALGRLDVADDLDGVEPGVDALDRLEAAGVAVLNRSRALSAAHDKLLTARALRRAALPHPWTCLLGPSSAPPTDLESPLVLKPRFGSWGRDVVLCRTADEVEDALAELTRRSWFREHGVLAQEVVPPLGWDLRIVVAGGRVVGAARRTAGAGEWRTNVSLGGRSEPVDPPPLARTLALSAAAAVRGDLVGVDLLPTRAAFVISEINGAVDFRPQYAVDFTDVYTDAVLQLLRVAHARRVAA